MFEKNWTAFHSPGQDQVRTETNESCIKMIKNSQNPFIINHKGFLSIGPVSEANQFSRFGRIRKEFSHIFDSFNHRRQNADSLQFQMRETRLVTIFLQFSSPGFWTATAALSGDNWQSAADLQTYPGPQCITIWNTATAPLPQCPVAAWQLWICCGLLSPSSIS